MAKQTKKQSKKMTEEHKKALARGREQGRIVREYLTALNTQKKPGRQLSTDELKKRIADLQAQIDAESDPVKRVELIQTRLEREEQLAEQQAEPDIAQLENNFIQVAKEYSERKGIDYPAWREAGVPAGVLKQAGIPQRRRASTQS